MDFMTEPADGQAGLIYGFSYEQLEIRKWPAQLRKPFSGMRARTEADRPIAKLGDAG
jgi:hypothetical protein